MTYGRGDGSAMQQMHVTATIEFCCDNDKHVVQLEETRTPKVMAAGECVVCRVALSHCAFVAWRCTSAPKVSQLSFGTSGVYVLCQAIEMVDARMTHDMGMMC